MKTIKRIIEDFKKGEEIDVYITLIFSIVITILSLSGYNLANYIGSLTIAIIALLTYSILKSRHQIKELISHTSLDANNILLKDVPEEEIIERIKKTKEALIVGPILQRTIKNHYSIYEELLQKEVSLRFLLVNPNNIASDIIAIRPYANVNVDRVKSEIQSTLASLENLKKETSGNVQIRTIDYPISFGGFFLDSKSVQGMIYLRFYPFKMRDRDRPKLKLNQLDDYWFNYFIQQAEKLWDYGKDWNK